MMTQRRGGGVDRPSRPNGGNVANQGGRWPAHHGIVGRSRGGGYYGGEGGGNSTTAAVAAECRRAESGVLSLTK